MEIKPTPVVKIHSELLIAKGVELFVKREDLNHPTISGNKARKLKYNLEKAREEEYDTLLTFAIPTISMRQQQQEQHTASKQLVS